MAEALGRSPPEPLHGRHVQRLCTWARHRPSRRGYQETPRGSARPKTRAGRRASARASPHLGTSSGGDGRHGLGLCSRRRSCSDARRGCGSGQPSSSTVSRCAGSGSRRGGRRRDGRSRGAQVVLAEELQGAAFERAERDVDVAVETRELSGALAVRQRAMAASTQPARAVTIPGLMASAGQGVQYSSEDRSTSSHAWHGR